MPAVRFPDGETVEFAEGTPKAAIDRYYAEKSGGPVQGGGFQNVANVANLATRYLSNRPQQGSTMPTLAGANVAFASPGTVETLMRTEQAARQDDLRAKMEQRRMIQQETEAEKARAAAIKLEQLRHKNQKSELEMRYAKDLDVIKAKNLTGKVHQGKDGAWYREVVDPETNEMSFELIKDAPPKEEKPVRGEVVNGVLVNPYTGQKMADLPEPKMTPQQLAGLTDDFMGYEILNVETGKYEPIPRNVAQDFAAQFAAGNRIFDSNVSIRKPQGSQSRLVEVKQPNGSTVLRYAQEGLETAPAGSGKQPDMQKAISIIKQGSGLASDAAITEVGRKQAMDILAASGEYPNSWINEFADSFGLYDDNSDWPMNSGAQYYLPEDSQPSAAQPATSQSQTTTPQAGPLAGGYKIPTGKRGFYTDDQGNKIPGVFLPNGMFQPD